MATFFVQSDSEEMMYENVWTGVVPSATTISTSAWTIAPVGPVLSDLGIDGLTTYFTVDGMTTGQDYTITNTIVLSNGEEYASSIFVLCEKK